VTNAGKSTVPQSEGRGGQIFLIAFPPIAKASYRRCPSPIGFKASSKHNHDAR